MQPRLNFFRLWFKIIITYQRPQLLTNRISFSQIFKNMRYLLTTVILLALNVIAFSQNISGKLLDKNGSGVEFATITLMAAADSSLVKGAISEADGSFIFDSPEKGVYFLEANFIGYATYTSDVFEFTGKNIQLPSFVFKEASQMLNEVTVTAKKPFIEIQADKMVLNTASSISAVGDNALELLRKAPGVVVDNNENVQLKGKSGVRIYIDGKPSYFSAQELANFLKGISSADIEAVEIITNPSAKFDAQGNAGIINIRLKKNKNFGTNGSLNAFYGQGYYHKSSLSLNLNNRVNKWNTYANFNIGNSKYFNEMNMYREQDGKIFDQTQRQASESAPLNTKLGVDYYASSKSTFGALVAVNTQYKDVAWRSFSNTAISNSATSTRIDSVLNATNTIENRNVYANVNLNYKYSDTLGNELIVDVDKGYYTARGSSYQPNFYVSQDGSQVFAQKIFANETPSIIDINTGKVDYTRSFKDAGITLTTGVKFSNVKTDNSFQFFNIVDGSQVKDITKSNDFAYTENVAAGYVNLNGKAGDKFSYQAGVRYEHTSSVGDLTRDPSLPATDKDYVERAYGNFFPSAALTYNLHKNHILNLTYSKRIQRPNYQSMNPFEFKLDELTFRRGNPFLTPQYNDNVELTYTVMQAANISLGFSHAEDVIVDIIERDMDVPNKAFINFRNLATSDNYSLSINTPLPIKKWWNGFASMTLYKTNFKARFEEYSFDNATPVAVNFYAENSFTLPKSYTFEVSGWFNSASIEGGAMLQNPMGQMDIGAKKSFLDNKLSLKVGLTDILRTARWSGENTVIPGLYMRANGRWDARRINVNLNYRFGNSNVKSARNRKTGLEDEAGRIGG